MQAPVVVIRTIEELRALKSLRGKLAEFTLVLDMPALKQAQTESPQPPAQGDVNRAP
jgi:hypothetical protein